ncbi:MAG: TonB family protein [Burkholderiales bacterium]|jgi:protein TonB|nr:TonB family protein [Burkholderiales bacterium]
MDYAYQQRRPTRHLVGIGGVILLHVLIVWALISGLARKVVEVVKGPIEVKVIEEVVQKPPPPPAPTISAVTREAPPAPQAPVIAKPVEAPKAAPPKVQSAQVVCQNYREVIGAIVYPREALREGLEGKVLIEFTVAADGRVKDVAVARSSNRIFNRVAARAAESMSCQGQGQDIRVVLPVGFTLK